MEAAGRWSHSSVEVVEDCSHAMSLDLSHRVAQGASEDFHYAGQQARSSAPTADLELTASARKIFKVRSLLRARAQQASIADGCWDILLCLYLQGELKITDLKKAVGVPLTTILRWLEMLHSQDLVGRKEKPGDRRATLIVIEEKGRQLVQRMLAEIDTAGTTAN